MHQKTKEELEVELKSLDFQILEINKQIKKGKKALKLIDQYIVIFDNLQKKVVNNRSGLQALLDSSKQTSGQIKELHSSAKTFALEAKKSLDSVNDIVGTINTFYQQFNELRENVESSDTGLAAILKSSQKVQSDINIQLTEATSKTEQIQELLDQSVAKLAEIGNSYDSFLKLKEDLENSDSGISAVLKQSIGLKDEIEATKNQTSTIFAEVSRIKDDANKFVIDIQDLKASAEEDRNKIEEYQRETFDFREKISKIYKLATDSSLANSFAERKNELYRGVMLWGVILIASVVLLSIAIAWVHDTVLSKNGDVAVNNLFWYRLTLTFPLLFLVGFSAQQYSKERSLLEKYAFKAATAFALESYSTLLISKFSKYEENIIDFVLSSMRIIYKEPYDATKESRMSMTIGNKLSEFKAEIIETFEEKIEKTIEGVLHPETLATPSENSSKISK